VADIVKRGLAVNNYLPLEHAVHIVRQTAAGLGYAHERREPDGHVLRIVHRDVSPTNVLVSFEGQTKIVDFGIARAQDELREESGTRPGKASYMSPEQVRGEAADYRSDIFSLGIILYELTLCQRLYRGAPELIMRKIVSETVTPPTAINRDYPPTLELIVMKALEKRPEDRYQSAEEMSHDLEEFLEESGLRSGNRRMAHYMHELFTPGAQTSAPGVAAARSFTEPRSQAASGGSQESSDELDLDRRAPLSMRIEVAPEPAAPAVRASSAGSGSAKVRAPASGGGSGSAKVRAPASGGGSGSARVRAPAAPTGSGRAQPSGPAAFAPPPSDQFDTDRVLKPARAGSWLVIALCIAIGVAAMVIMTLK
jgi:serine/threonine-protein kinase